MTVPHGDLEALLRRELTAAVDSVEPSADALERIRARTVRRPPQPWLLNVLSDVVSRAQHWVWRGHWAWPDSLPQPGAGVAARAGGGPGQTGAAAFAWCQGRIPLVVFLMQTGLRHRRACRTGCWSRRA